MLSRRLMVTAADNVIITVWVVSSPCRTLGKYHGTYSVEQLSRVVSQPCRFSVVSFLDTKNARFSKISRTVS